MSAVADFFLVREAAAIERATPALTLGRIDSVTLAELWAALQGVPYRDEMEAAFELLNDDDAGVFLFRLPEDFVERLAALPHERVGEIAQAWTAYEEVAAEADALADIVAQLAGLARQAAEKRTSVFLRLTT